MLLAGVGMMITRIIYGVHYMMMILLMLHVSIFNPMNLVILIKIDYDFKKQGEQKLIYKLIGCLGTIVLGIILFCNMTPLK